MQPNVTVVHGCALNFGMFTKKSALRDRLGREDVVAQAPFVRVRDLDLLLLLEVVALDAADAMDHRLEARLLERGARGDGDAAALADGELA